MYYVASWKFGTRMHFYFLSLFAFVFVRNSFFFLFISLAFVQKSMAKKKGGNSREFQDFTDDGILYWDFSFVSFSRICVRLCSLRLSASAALGLSHSATHKYEAYDRTDVIFFINHRRKTDS